MSYEHILVERREAVGLITLNRPQALNAFSTGLIAEVARALGGHGVLVDAPDEIGPAIEQALAADGPTVIQVVVDDRENVHPPGLDEFHGMYAAEHT